VKKPLLGFEDEMSKHSDRTILAAANALLPVFSFIILYEATLAFTAQAFEWLSAGSDAVTISLLDVSEADFKALGCGIGMALSFLPFASMCGSAVRRAGYTAAGKDTDASGKDQHDPLQLQRVILAMGTICLSLGLNSLFSLTGFSKLMSSDTLNTGSVALPVGIAVFGMLTPFVEESMFRILVYDRLTFEAGIGKRQAVLMGAAIFAVYHGSPAQALYAFIMSFVFFYVWTSERQPGTVCALHASCNIFSLLLTSAGVYNLICTPVWCACLLTIALICGVSLKPSF